MTDAPRVPPIADPPIRLAVCVSGGGTTLQNLIDQIRAGRLRAEIVQVVASRPGIGAIARAEAAGIPLALATARRRTLADFSAVGLRPDPPERGRPRRSSAGSSRWSRSRPTTHGRVINIHPVADPRLLRQGLPRPGRPPGRDRVRRQGLRLHRPLRRRRPTTPARSSSSAPSPSSTTTPPRPSPPASSRPNARPSPRPSPSYAAGRLSVEGRRVRIRPGG